MLGTSLDSPGGMTSVVRTLRDGGLFDAWYVEYIETDKVRRAITQLRVMSVALWRLVTALAANRVSLVHAHSASRGSFWRKSLLCALARLFGVPYLFHLHSGEFPVFYQEECNPVAKWWVRLTLRKASLVISLTESWRALLCAIEPTIRVVVVGNPVEVPIKLPTMRDPAINVLFLGRLREKKGVFDLVRALPAVLRQCPQLRFVLAGDEGEKEVLSLATALGVESAIHLPGWVDGEPKAALLREADLFVLPSYFEGLPVGLLEAMALGIPIVSCVVGGIPDLIEDGKHGLLVQPGDTTALAAAIVHLARHAPLRQSLRVAAHERVRSTYALPTLIAALGDLYAQLGCPKRAESNFGGDIRR